MSRTAFVTGADGFIGVNLVEELLAQGWEVTAMHRADAKLQRLEQLAAQRVIGDVTDHRSLRAAMPAQVDVVFHAATNTSLWSRQRIEQLKVNVKGTRNAVRVALETRAGRFIHTSSLVAYGLHGGTVSEDTPSRGLGSTINYVRSKALAEREIRQGISRGLNAVIINPAHVIGPHDEHNWSRVFRMVERGRLPAMPGGGGSFCHVRSVVRAHVAAVDRGRAGANYLLGGADSSYIGLARAIAKLMKVPVRPRSLPLPALRVLARLDELMSPLLRREPELTVDAIELLSTTLYCRNGKAVAELGYEPLPLATLLEDCHRWMIASGRLKSGATET
ncbi:SDR family NAD(P)-dependent oxidoreductase [uncultured Nevskia sp.]|uniref:SDR family NAD(P)-dependent oxidoreductase n=1 Tax=uncultured Nevskia sp. TaxID=228950 RepID=UPI0025D93046|nr:SDR family NAD(P)-dependent oxidoreductase [uncultured Nevskia sp.]